MAKADLVICVHHSAYHHVPKFSDGQVWANSADPEQTAPIWVCTICNSGCIFWMHYSKEKSSCSTFRVITAHFWGVRNFRIFTVHVGTCTFHQLPFQQILKLNRKILNFKYRQENSHYYIPQRVEWD